MKNRKIMIAIIVGILLIGIIIAGLITKNQSLATIKCSNCGGTARFFKKGATCTTDGYQGYLCDDCNTTTQYKVLKKLGHNYSPATCTTAKKCTRCGATSGSALGHSYTAATCTTAKRCTRCNATSGSALGHNYSPATCTTARKCTRCSATTGTALGHSYTAATCTTAKRCTRCNATSGSALGHSYTAATCTAAKKCTRCGVTTGSALGHSYSAATCTTAKKCTRCGVTTGSALGHSYTAATCTSAKKCTRCGVTSGSALGHNYSPATCTSAKKCTRCGVTSGSALGHNYSPATCTTAPKCTRCGVTSGSALGHSGGPSATCTTAQKCTRCNQVIKAALGHLPGPAATCTSAQVCTRCNTVLNAKLSHTYGTTPTSYNKTANGHTPVYQCTSCTATKTGTQETHTINTWTDNNNGTHSGTCTVCNYKSTKTHTYDANNVCTACGATTQTECEHDYEMKNNSTEHWEECKKCHITKDGSIENHNVAVWRDNNDGTHSGTCTKCNYTKTTAHEYSGNTCTKCGSTKATECEHNWVMKNNVNKHWQECSKCNVTKEGSLENHNITTWTDNRNGAHEGTCTVCNYKVTKLHNYGDDNKCTDCGATKQAECEHNWTTKSNEYEHWQECSKCNITKDDSREAHKVTTWEDNGDGTHSGACTVCNYKVTKPHNYNDDNKCSDCGITKPKGECEHEWEMKYNPTEHWQECSKCHTEKENSRGKHMVTTWLDRGNGTHSGTCTKCNYEVISSHNFNNGECSDCKAKEEDQQNCEHDWIMKNNENGHWKECSKCHITQDGTAENHKVTNWKDNGDGTHSGMCTVCDYNVTESHNYNDDNKCTDCGTTKPKGECEHDWREKSDNTYHWDECTKCGKVKNKEEHTVTDWEDNGDGTHKGTCTECDQTVTRNHEEGSNSKCKDCNASMNNNNNDNNNNSSNNNVDKTNSGKELPNTGKKTGIISVIGLTTLFGTSIVGIKKYKDIV